LGETLAANEKQISIIVPTLNEEIHIKFLLESLGSQRQVRFETLVLDGGSKDQTTQIASQHNARVIVLPAHGEFISRNIGAKMAEGTILLFTCADIIFPPDLFRKILEKFDENPALVALTGPGYPYDASVIGKAEYTVYNLVRFLFSSLPGGAKRFSTSTNFLAVRKDCFEKTGGFLVDDINADGLMGRKLLELGEVAFFLDTHFYLSARRMKKMGFLEFNKHYLYALENFLFFASRAAFVQSSKSHSKSRHRKIHEV
jgi:glycosyltransferase involved in cell wall biosynthesis